MDTLRSVALMLFLYSLLFTVLSIINPKKFLFILTPLARTRKKAVFCSVYLIIFTFFLFGFFIPTDDQTVSIPISLTACLISGFFLYRQIIKARLLAGDKNSKG